MFTFVDQFEELADLLAEQHRLDHEGGELLAGLYLGADFAADGPLPEPARRLAAIALCDAKVTELFLVHLDTQTASDDAAVDRLAAEVLGAYPRCPGVHLLGARMHERTGDLGAMEAALRRTISLAPDHAVAHRELADLAMVRGDFRSARRHDEAGGRLAVGWVAIAASLADCGPMRAGRNERCPCGSGRKHKTCCARTGGWPLQHRARLLFEKLTTWAGRRSQLRTLLPLGLAAAGVEDWDEAPELVAAAVGDPALAELHLFEGGGLDALAAPLALLLPSDEAELLGRWLGARHSVWEVLRAGSPDRSWVLRDVRTSVTAEVASLGETTDPLAGALLWALLLPGGAGDDDTFAAGEVLALSADDADTVRSTLDSGADVRVLARLLLGPGLAGVVAARDAAADRGAVMLERARWLFGDLDLRPHDIGDPGFVDDLVTTTFMAGGGFTPAADMIRWAAHLLLAADPPEIWDTALRLEAKGLDRGVILVHLAAAMHVTRVETSRDPSLDPIATLNDRLDALPELVPAQPG